MLKKNIKVPEGFIHIKTSNIIKKPMIIGLMTIRNESLIIDDSLDEMAKIADSIIVIDDDSTDNTLAHLFKHPKVTDIVLNKKWDSGENRGYTEGLFKSIILNIGKQYKPKWFLLLDADERIENPKNVRKFMLDSVKDKSVQSIEFKLFDAYMTKGDCKPYIAGSLFNFRKKFGIERREIVMAWKDDKSIYYDPEGMLRVPLGIDLDRKAKKDFYIQHYGKCLSIDHWEETCDYYIKHYPMFSEKWKQRKGKGVHGTKSDFGTKLMTWKEVKKDGGVLIQ